MGGNESVLTPPSLEKHRMGDGIPFYRSVLGPWIVLRARKGGRDHTVSGYESAVTKADLECATT